MVKTNILLCVNIPKQNSFWAAAHNHLSRYIISDKYKAILSSNDPGEPARKGGLLVAQHGDGNFIYTGYSWFRQLPAGVPGAYRIFANMVSLNQNNKP